MQAYSGTPLAKKLGIKEGNSIVLTNAPDHYFELFTDFPKDTITPQHPLPKTIDFIHLFAESMEQLSQLAPELKTLLKDSGMIWVSWPKGTSKIPTDLNRELVRAFMLKETGLVDIKVAAIDADWSGLKFVIRLKDRK